MNRSVLLQFSVISLCTVLPACYGAAQDETTDGRVAVLIARMLKADTEQKAFSDLDALGCAAKYAGQVSSGAVVRAAKSCSAARFSRAIRSASLRVSMILGG